MIMQVFGVKWLTFSMFRFLTYLFFIKPSLYRLMRSKKHCSTFSDPLPKLRSKFSMFFLSNLAINIFLRNHYHYRFSGSGIPFLFKYFTPPLPLHPYPHPNTFTFYSSHTLTDRRSSCLTNRFLGSGLHFCQNISPTNTRLPPPPKSPRNV